MSDNDLVSSIDLTGQVAIVTGGGRGLGRAYAQALAAHGAVVAVAARSAAQLDETVATISAAGGHALAYPLDVTDRKAVEAMVADVAQQLGPVDLLVNNAGIVSPIELLWNIDPDEWWRTIEINLRSVVLCAHAVVPGMVRHRHGRIINLSSGAGTVSIPYVSAYVTSKTAIIRLSEVLAEETKDYGIAVFAINPGDVRTPMAEYLLNLPHIQDWNPEYPKMFEERRDYPIEGSVQFVLRLAAGHADSLSGCYLSVHHDLDRLVQNAEQIAAERLYSLRIRSLG